MLKKCFLAIFYKGVFEGKAASVLQFLPIIYFGSKTRHKMQRLKLIQHKLLKNYYLKEVILLNIMIFLLISLL